jgi:hypothetical protein
MLIYDNSTPGQKPTVGSDGLFSGTVEHRYDASKYSQKDSYGQSHSLDTLSREDLLQIACHGIEAMEKMDILMDQMMDKQQTLIDFWRKDKALPEISE